MNKEHDRIHDIVYIGILFYFERSIKTTNGTHNHVLLA